MSTTLTELEKEVLSFIETFLAKNTFQPSLREIGKKIGVRSTKSVCNVLNSIEDKGFIERDIRRSRGIKIKGLKIKIHTKGIYAQK